eukprot:NODE_7060_length_470_cov_26.895044_g6894_i0.p1 GENE.NODE_7060_length_470_cov_26.895044_g6894_i0~~NODE_7060_length_470_cov_26.895044_g6894_i0.p1  ORF type:complete len:118 (-),score=33.65 NODE_7060_length_470_cov_26.895044_g6894_i0:32-385(-)
MVNTFHQEACDLFLRLGLQYTFTCTLLAAEPPSFRFLFSKPQQHSPIPAITVFADVTHEERLPDNTIVYSVLMEGQQFVQTVYMNPERIDGTEFNAKWIDWVFKQKERLRTQFLKLA